MTKSQIISQVKEIILRHAKPQRIFLYGSQVTGEATQNSDIDIAYDEKDFGDHYKIKEIVDKVPAYKQAFVELESKIRNGLGEKE